MRNGSGWRIVEKSSFSVDGTDLRHNCRVLEDGCNEIEGCSIRFNGRRAGLEAVWYKMEVWACPDEQKSERRTFTSGKT